MECWNRLHQKEGVILIQDLRGQHVVETAHGQIQVYGAVAPAELAALDINPSLHMFRPAERQKEALIKIAGMPEGAVVIARHQDTIVGYCTFHPCDASSRYANRGLPVIELGALEVASDWRFMRVGRNVLETAFGGGALEDYIVVATEYAWHWDLDSTGLSVWQYRKLLYDILSNVGLEQQKTDDPEICGHPANMLTVRYGIRVSPADSERFRSILILTPR